MSGDAFVVGPDFNVESPAEIAVTFLAESGVVNGILLRPTEGAEVTATRVPLTEQEVVFQSGDVTLSGTLIVPEGARPRPAIALLHGSGPLTRYSFGPYPRFFASLGFAVLIYDKPGTGASTGTRVDASTGRSMAPTFYPEDPSNDALAALALLRKHPDVDGPLWQTTLYQAAALPRQNGAAEVDIRDVRYVHAAVARRGPHGSGLGCLRRAARGNPRQEPPVHSSGRAASSPRSTRCVGIGTMCCRLARCPRGTTCGRRCSACSAPSTR